MTAGSCARGTGAGGAALSRLGGILTNAVNMTMTYGPSGTTISINANKATYVGSMYMDPANGQVTCTLAWGQNRKFGLWNAYNRVPIILQVGDSTASWAYSTATTRAANGFPASYSATEFNFGSGTVCNGMVIFSGLAEESYDISYTDIAQMAVNAAAGGMIVGIGFNSTTAITGTRGLLEYSSALASAVNINSSIAGRYGAPPSLGINNICALEQAIPADGATMLGTQASMLLQAQWRG